MTGGRRSQSEVVGVVLLTAVIVVLVAVIGVAILGQFESQTEREPRVTINSGLAEENLTLTHAGGDSFDARNIQVNLRGITEQQFRLTENGTFVAGRDSTVFEAGDIWEFEDKDFSTAGELRITVVDQNSGTVIHQNRFVVENDD